MPKKKRGPEPTAKNSQGKYTKMFERTTRITGGDGSLPLVYHTETLYKEVFERGCNPWNRWEEEIVGFLIETW